MALLPLTTCAQMLGIHPKTLHHWLKEANLPLSTHPTDARIKCVAEKHLLEVAKRHGRPLPVLPAVPKLSGPSMLDEQKEQAASFLASEGDLHPPLTSASGPSTFEVDLIQKLSSLETKVVTLQEQLAQVALALLQERERTIEHRIAALESLTQSLAGRHLLSGPQGQAIGQESACVVHRERQLLPEEQRARSRIPALIEYSAQGIYVSISSQEGELHLVPDSAEWFDWLATLPSFRFVGQQGRFTAYRHSRSSRSWRAHRVIHQRSYKQTLGVTDHLTIHRLEQVAAALQSDRVSL
jgi:hypothetical protein